MTYLVENKERFWTSPVRKDFLNGASRNDNLQVFDCRVNN